MSDRGVLFLFGLGVILAALGVALWLITTSQAAYVDGLFLVLSCFVLALAFGLYVKYLIRSVMAADAKAAVPAPAASREKLATRATAPAEQTLERAR
ncbi:MAG: hypothetical protein LAP39_20680 [Acidobacteriia bacterium]|nr:hypothetical protein [Terriglobia bacterium]